jgi:phosphate uptake regulator
MKALQVGGPEIGAGVRDDTYHVNNLHRDIVEIADDLLMTEPMPEWDLSFTLTSIRIADALQAVHTSAVEVSENSVYLLGFGGPPKCILLARFGETVAGFMRSCVVALLDAEIDPARRVLDAIGVERSFATGLYDWYRTIDPNARVDSKYVLEIGKHLSQMARQIYEVADAMVFWIERREVELPVQGNAKPPVLLDQKPLLPLS